MPSKRRKGHAITPNDNDDKQSRHACIPEFKNARKFAETKVTMLERDFRIALTEKQRLHLLTLKTERDINAAVRKIINEAWGD